MTVDTVRTTRLEPLAAIGRAAAGAVDRSAFLPVAAREAARLLGASACEVWLDDDGPTLAAVYRSASKAVRSPARSVLAGVLEAGENVHEADWLCVPIRSKPKPRGVLAVAREGPWSPDDEALADVSAVMIGLSLEAATAGRFDDAARDQFLALLGHDLRSPLSNVRVGAQLARRNLDAGDLESVREALTIIENQSARLVARLEALLDAVAADGRWLIRLEPLDLGAMAEAAVDPFRLTAREAGTGTSFSVLVEAGTPWARGDAVQVAQVLEHLVDNAAKYAAGGHVELTVRREDGTVRVDVTDDGPGIRPEDVDRVFAPFGRGRTTASKGGYGLGLYLARNIINAHGGRLWIARTSRSGTAMAFILPAAEGDEA